MKALFHCFLRVLVDVEKPDASLILTPLKLAFAFSQREAFRNFPLSLMFWNFTMSYWEISLFFIIFEGHLRYSFNSEIPSSLKKIPCIFFYILSIFSIISFWNSCFHMRLIQRLLLIFPYISCLCLLFSGRFAHLYLPFFWIFYLATPIFKFQDLFIAFWLFLFHGILLLTYRCNIFTQMVICVVA